jgi:TPR repeat protein
VVKDHAEAAKWYRKAAEQNYAEAQYNLGLGYYKGEGVAKDQAEAVKWYRKAGEQNYAEAQYNLGICYEGATAWRRIGSRLTSGCCWQRGKALRLLRST